MSGPKCDVIEVGMGEFTSINRMLQERERFGRNRIQSEREIILVKWDDSFDKMEDSLLEEERLAKEKKRLAKERRQAEERRRIEEQKRLEKERREKEHRRMEEQKRLEEKRREEEKRRQKALNDAHERRIAELIMEYEKEDREWEEERERKEQKAQEEQRIREEQKVREEREAQEEERMRKEERAREEKKARIAEERRRCRAFEEAVVDYEAAADLAGVPPVHYEFSPETAEHMIEKLREESEKLRKQALDAACSRRVDELIDQTVEDMGYHLLGTRETGGVRRAVSKLYRYDENTALHVIGVDGQFTMEVVAVDNVDREPTEKEKERLESSMERFCGDYERIMERLEQTGKLNIKPVFHMPVSKKYASVINKTAYRKEEKEKRGMVHGADYMSETGGNESVQKSAKIN